MPKYDRPNWFVQNILNPVYETLVTKTSMDLGGAWVLTVKGRKSGQPLTVPLNLLTFDGSDYLVAPRGETEWARNLRTSGGGTLSKGSKERDFTVEEVEDSEKPPILKAYIDRWFMATRGQWDGATKDTPAEELAAQASDHPVFRLTWTS